ncbi:hypothetical protein J5N97_000553 [Dioscorea zingiberensis]|uniref:Uncharacterized protein n=1 Tax=Dioscorea zingiberensis TaxID=325984 RepID=A0A9D5BVE0_9LILI|nr:hypothetical protein J5N97_000553 [Dioscorea zingiberensis]
MSVTFSSSGEAGASLVDNGEAGEGAGRGLVGEDDAVELGEVKPVGRRSRGDGEGKTATGEDGEGGALDGEKDEGRVKIGDLTAGGEVEVKVGSGLIGGGGLGGVTEAAEDSEDVGVGFELFLEIVWGQRENWRNGSRFQHRSPFHNGHGLPNMLPPGSAIKLCCLRRSRRHAGVVLLLVHVLMIAYWPRRKRASLHSFGT